MAAPRQECKSPALAPGLAAAPAIAAETQALTMKSSSCVTRPAGWSRQTCRSCGRLRCRRSSFWPSAQAAHAGALDRRDVHEHVGAAAVLRDEAEAFSAVEEFARYRVAIIDLLGKRGIALSCTETIIARTCIRIRCCLREGPAGHGRERAKRSANRLSGDVRIFLGVRPNCKPRRAESRRTVCWLVARRGGSVQSCVLRPRIPRHHSSRG